MQNVSNAPSVQFMPRGPAIALGAVTLTHGLIIMGLRNTMERGKIMFSLREYLIKIAENTGCTISYDEKLINDMVQDIYRSMLTWGKGMKMREILDFYEL